MHSVSNKTKSVFTYLSFLFLLAFGHSAIAVDTDKDGIPDAADANPLVMENYANMYTFLGDGAGDFAGWSADGAGDVNNDGYDDLITGMYNDDNNGRTNSGSARVLSGVNGNTLYTFDGDSASDFLGFSVSGAGDVNGDGYADLIVGAYQDDNTGANSGSIRIYNGLTGAIIRTTNGSLANDNMGWSVNNAGDVNNDGYADYIAGAPLYDRTSTETAVANRGIARVYNGNTGAVLWEIKGDNASDNLGYSVAGAGDVNNDGYDDLIVGAPYDDNGGLNNGMARVVSGVNGTTLYSFNGAADDDRLGWSVSGAGDVNNDGYADVIAGAFQNDTAAPDAGAAYVYSGATGAILYSFYGDLDTDLLGRAVGGAGDMNGDGYDDVIAGMRAADNNNPGTFDPLFDSGSARVYSGVDGAILFTFNGDDSLDNLGQSVNGAGDVNNDGYADVIAGAWQDETNGAGAGFSRVYSGALFLDRITDTDGDTIVDTVDPDDDNDGMPDVWENAYGLDPFVNDAGLDPDTDGLTNLQEYANDSSPISKDGDNDGLSDVDDPTPLVMESYAAISTFNGDGFLDQFGTAVRGLGDLNGDGYDDFGVGAYFDDNNGADSGSVRVISGATNSVLYTVNGDAAGDYFGYSLSAAGDVNKDGYDDFVVGAYLDDNGGVDSLYENGSARVFSGIDGAILYTFDGDNADDNLGTSVSAAGDVNGDGYPDILVGIPTDDNNGIDSGSARVLSGSDGAILYTFSGDSAGDRLGTAVAGVGDVNNDGYADVVAGVPFDDNNSRTNSGSVRVYSGFNGAVLYTLNGDTAGDRLGNSVSAAGDVNKDGYDDVLAGAPFDDNTGGDSGSARVFSGVNGDILYTVNGDNAGDQLGVSVDAAGDVNADTYPDFIAGAWWDDNNGANSGSAKVFSGSNGALLYTFNGDSADDQFGVSVSGAGDVDGDGYSDLLAGANNDDNTFGNAGSARLFSGDINYSYWDTDGDGYKDPSDLFRLDPAEWADQDTDGVGNNGDNCPSISNPDQLNTDGQPDGGNACDNDDDNDGVPDGSDAFPLDPTESVDTDNDGVGNNGDNCPSISNLDQLNTDGQPDGGNACDNDDDNDGMPDTWEITYGLDPLVDDASGDADNDTFTNLQEYQASTNPADAGSYPSGAPAAVSTDMDQDGDSDVFWRRPDTGQSQVWVMQSGVRSALNDLSYSSTGLSVAGLGDFNGDGDADVLLHNLTTGEWVVIAVQGAVQQSRASIGYTSTSLNFKAIGDVDNDGDEDVILRDETTGEFKVMRMQNHAKVSVTSLGYVGTSLLFKGLADADNDGDKDIVLRNDSTGEIKVRILQSGAGVSTNSYGYNGAAFSVKTILDADADGDEDVLLRNDATGQMLAVISNNGTRLQTNSLGYNSATLSFTGTGDVNGDGAGDILLRNSSTGENVRVLLSGGLSAGNLSLGYVGTAYTYAGRGDFDGDGDDDFLFRDGAYGANVRVAMQAGAKSAQGLLNYNNVNLVPYLKK